MAISLTVTGLCGNLLYPEDVDADKMLPPGTSKPTRLIIVRHGETSWNAEKRVQGQTDTKLNAAGQQQALELADRFKKLGLAETVDAVVSSDLSRASDTADAIAEVCPKAKRYVDARLREFDFGEHQGKLSSDPEVRPARQTCVQEWKQGHLEYASHGAESAANVIGRGLAAFRSAARLGSSVVIVSHGGLIKWTAVAIELAGETPDHKALSQPKVVSIVQSSLPNVCCSIVLYDHSVDAFRAQSWFENLIGQTTRDDSG
eukprot:TRINITY_DN18208_c0_g1_i2.p1 TRINITY_DN18208_c0_g1~~TRINITY_DN18208_c0_g1_i2.p1  ORF type:complete len:260 (-),score=41.18 TRINITY_DN18208_c0_g1_i2:131-910(-)